MFEYADSPPSLRHSPTPSDLSQGPSRDSTPITPVTSTLPLNKKDSSIPWFKKAIDVGRTTTKLCVQTPVLEPDFDDNTYPLFGGLPETDTQPMAGAAGPIPISARQTSTSPRGNQPSTLTSALQESAANTRPAVSGINIEQSRQTPQIIHDQMTDNYRPESGARPIPVKGRPSDKMRRESLAQSLGTGMSWGGVSVNSWIRDE
jgi:transcription factor SFP1